MQGYIILAPIVIGGGILCKKFYDTSKELSSIRDPKHKETMVQNLMKTFKLVKSSCYSYLARKCYSYITEKPSKNLSLVSYYHNMTWYKFPVITKRGPKLFLTR